MEEQDLRTKLQCVFQVARSLGILDEVNRMKVVPGASPSSRPTNKNARYMEVNTQVIVFLVGLEYHQNLI